MNKLNIPELRAVIALIEPFIYSSAVLGTASIKLGDALSASAVEDAELNAKIAQAEQDIKNHKYALEQLHGLKE